MRATLVYRRPLRVAASFAVLAVAGLVSAKPALGFETSCDPAVAVAFDDAVTQLHSFEYPESGRRFQLILRQDPDCAMARWGMAMSQWHPLWAPPSEAARREAREVLADTGSLTATPREFAYLRAISLYFADNDMRERERRVAYREAMRELHETDRDDTEAAVFYALSLLATADPQDKSYAQQYKSAAILNWVRETQPQHPGVLHYLIHSYDYPGLAHLALSAAEIYADAAPDSAHAQHMPSHIFTRLGLWEQSLSSNHDSTASAAEYTERANLPGHYDEGLHGIDYLMYAMLQTARDDEATALLAHLRGIGKTHPENFKVAFTYAASPARYVLERRDWDAASELPLGFDSFEWRDYPWAVSMNRFARGLGAARSGQPDLARQELAAIQALQVALPAGTQTYFREEVQVHIDIISAWLAHADGNPDAALELARAAADREDAVDKHPVTPGEVLPARELLGDLLLENGRAADALAAYRQVLVNSPGRLNAHIGAARAATEARDPAAADFHYAEVVRIAQHGGADRAGVAEARGHAPR